MCVSSLERDDSRYEIWFFQFECCWPCRNVPSHVVASRGPLAVVATVTIKFDHFFLPRHPVLREGVVQPTSSIPTRSGCSEGKGNGETARADLPRASRACATLAELARLADVNVHQVPRHRSQPRTVLETHSRLLHAPVVARAGQRSMSRDDGADPSCSAGGGTTVGVTVRAGCRR